MALVATTFEMVEDAQPRYRKRKRRERVGPGFRVDTEVASNTTTGIAYRLRYHGQGKRGSPPRQALELGNLRLASHEIDHVRELLVDELSPAMTREARVANRASIVSKLKLAVRLLEDVIEPANGKRPA